jgi:hypothetical protein
MHCLEISTGEQTLKSSRELSWCRREECAAAVREVSMRQVDSMVEDSVCNRQHNCKWKLYIAIIESIVFSNSHSQTAANHATISNIVVFILRLSTVGSIYCGMNCFDVSTQVLLFMGMMTISPGDDIDTTPSGFAFCRHVLFV